MAIKKRKGNGLEDKINKQMSHLQTQLELAIEAENNIRIKRLRIEGAISILNRILK